MQYKIPDHLRGDTFDGTVFTVTVNGIPLDLTGASIKMSLVTDLKTFEPVLTLSTPSSGMSIVSATAGKFQINKQVISLAPNNYYFDIQITLADGTVKTYIKGTWKILQDITT